MTSSSDVMRVICPATLRAPNWDNRRAGPRTAHAAPWPRLVLAAAPSQQPHDDEDGGRDQAGDDERLERCGEPADGRDDEPYGEDRAKDCTYYPAHVPMICARRPPIAHSGGESPAFPRKRSTQLRQPFAGERPVMPPTERGVHVTSRPGGFATLAAIRSSASLSIGQRHRPVTGFLVRQGWL